MRFTRSEARSFAISTAVGILSFGALFIAMYRHSASDLLTVRGLGNLKFYTVLSNLLNGAASLIWAAALYKNKGSGRSPGAAICRLRLCAVASVGLTFAMVMFFLGPLYGHRYMYSGANLWYHLLLPVISMIDFVLPGPGNIPGRPDRAAAALPTVLYGAAYALNLALRGVRRGPDPNDWYGFLLWGWGVGAVIFAAAILAQWTIACALCAIKKAVAKRFDSGHKRSAG